MVCHPRTLRILLLGANGQLGVELRRALAPLGELIASDRCGPRDLHLDVCEESEIRRVMARALPDVVVNATSFRAPDMSALVAPRAYAVNARGPELIAEACAQFGAGLIHFSTDQVFSGDGGTAYAETDPPDPIGVYGSSKLAGEQAVLAGDAPILVLRSGWIFTTEDGTLLRTLADRLAREHRLAVADTDVGAPIWAGALAGATADILRQISSEEATFLRAFDLVRGIYHIAPEGRTSWTGFARRLAAVLGSRCVVEAAWGAVTAAPPRGVQLDASKAARVFQVRLPHWESSLQHCFRRAA